MHTSSLILQVSLNDDSFQSVQSMSLMIPSEIKMPLRVCGRGLDDRRGAGAAERLAADRIVRHHMAWKYETFGPDGQCKLFGVNIFDYDWQTTGKRVKVKDPIYHQDHTFEVWQVEIDGQNYRFAAGEFSNCVWGFYLETQS